MMNFNNLTLDLIPGITPLQKYENMKKIAELLNDLAFPKRGSEAENADAIYFASIAEDLLESGPIDIPA